MAVCPAHLMNADSAPVGRQPSDQANRLGLRVRVCQKEMAATVHIHRRHLLLLIPKAILILPSHGGWKAEST